MPSPPAFHRPSAAAMAFIPIAIVLTFSQPPCCCAQEEAAKPSAAALFEQTLAERGLEAALDRLREVLADTTAAYAVEPFELLRVVPNRLVLSHHHAEALELLEVLAGTFGDSPLTWFELGNAHLRCGNKEAARDALGKALAMAPDRADIAWMIEHLDSLLATLRLQVERERMFAPGESTGLQGPYLGQRPPGGVPEVFAPGIVGTTAHEYHISFTPDGREVYFSRGGVGTLVSRWRDDGWTAPEAIELLDAEHLTEEANVTPDGKAIVFCGRRGLRAERELYRAERIGDGWGRAVKLFPGMYATATLDGALYYTARGEGRDYGAIVRRPRAGADYGEPVVVPGGGINSEFPDAHPFVAPNESFLLFDSYRQPGAGIYATFRQPDGSWSTAVLLNDRLGIPPVGQCAVSPDGRYLWFCLAGDMWWVDAAFLDELRAKTGK